MNAYVAGMLAASTYEMRHAVTSGASIVHGPSESFTTGTPSREFPRFAVRDPVDAQSSIAEGVLIHGLPGSPVATDLYGRVLWYYDSPPSSIPLAFDHPATRVIPGGTVLLVASSEDRIGHFVREIDLRGNVIRETNSARLNEQLALRGQGPISGFHHEAMRLPSGETLVLAYFERLMSDVQGVSGPVDILGDMVIALDSNWQVSWTWNSFEFLDVNRASRLSDVCYSGTAGCATLLYAPSAHDWLHTNAITYSPSDGNLLLSVRGQDWIIKIDYRNGSGSGALLWRLGIDGDFTLRPANGNKASPDLWFTHQHDPALYGTELVIYDNGNTRCASSSQSPCNSRGQVLNIDEPNRVATLQLNADLGYYSGALGSAQRLSNGNYHFLSGFIYGQYSQSLELLPDGTPTYALDMATQVYRSYRLRNLYSP